MEASQDKLFFVDIPGIAIPVMPEESLLGKSRFQILEHYQNKTGDIVIVDDSSTINKIAYALKDGSLERREAELFFNNELRDEPEASRSEQGL